MSDDPHRYLQLGVSAGKADVHAAIKNLPPGVVTPAFCRIMPDVVGHSDQHASIIHADGAGTKAVLAYLWWKETGDIHVWRQIAQDALVMNLDDVMCAGADDGFLYCSLINRNQRCIPGSVVQEIVTGTLEFIEHLRTHHINLEFGGGETADLGDIVRTISVDGALSCRIQRSSVIAIRIEPGDVIIGFASAGQARYETNYTSGIGSNGLTLARHELLNKTYLHRYPETVDPTLAPSLLYCGPYRLTDRYAESEWSVGQLLLSPTRSYAPLLKQLLTQFRKHIHGLIHCTGGGQTKVLHFVDRLHIIKDNLFPLPPVFQLITAHSQASPKEWYQTFNMGHRLELYCPQSLAPHVIDCSASLGIPAQIIGSVHASDKKLLTLRTPWGQWSYAPEDG